MADRGQARDEARAAIVTGATGRIGKAIARGIAATGCAVVLACRNAEKAAQSAKEIRAATGNARVRPEVVDVSRKASVEAFAARWRGPLHLLVNNAAVTPRRREETPEGIERQFATNVLGYVWMIRAFAETLKQSAPSRVVNVASYWAGDLELDDLEFRKRPYNNNEAYRQSKQADRMLTVAFAERLQPFGVTVNACHPGDVNSPLSNNLGFAGSQSPDEGARTPVWLATDAVGGQFTGKYFEDRQEVRCPFTSDRRAIARLLEACLRF
jgi:NAD(P)-dependent dehydrogenase (short-subunit alcohol dehydrogenase family)